MKHIKLFAPDYISERVENYNQLSLFDDQFSSKTIINKLLQGSKSSKIIDKSDSISTARDAYKAMNNLETIVKASTTAISDDSGDSFTDHIRIDALIIAQNIPTNAKGLYDFMTLLFDQDALGEDESYSRLLDGFDLLEEAEFIKVFNNSIGFDMYPKDIAQDLANHLEYIDKHSFDTICELFGNNLGRKMLYEQVQLDPKCLDQSWLDDLKNNIKEYRNSPIINIYRSITLPYSLKDLETAMTKAGGVGVFWSYDENSAEAYNGNDIGFSVTLKASVNVRNVDWNATIYKSIYNLAMEREIELKGGITVDIIGYDMDCDNINKLVTSLSSYYQDELKLNSYPLKTLRTNLENLHNVNLPRPITVRA